MKNNYDIAPVLFSYNLMKLKGKDRLYGFKKVCIRALSVILIVFLIPVGIWGYGKAAPYLVKIASGSAGITMGDYNTFKYKGGLSSAEEAVKAHSSQYL